MDPCLRFAISNLLSTWILGLVISSNNYSWKEPQSHFLHKDAESQCSEAIPNTTQLITRGDTRPGLTSHSPGPGFLPAHLVCVTFGSYRSQVSTII